MKEKVLLLAFITLFTGCGEETKKETFKTVSYYEKNKDIRKNRLIECKQLDTMTTTIEKDCNNAKKAEHNSKKSISIDWGRGSL